PFSPLFLPTSPAPPHPHSFPTRRSSDLVVTDLQSWLRRHPKPTEQELLDIARALLHAQPSMAPLLRLANDVALAADAEDASRAFPFSLSQLHKALVSAPGKIANHFWRALPRHPDRFMTYSYSSTVLKALVRE